jgi:hypothetical protein
MKQYYFVTLGDADLEDANFNNCIESAVRDQLADWVNNVLPSMDIGRPEEWHVDIYESVPIDGIETIRACDILDYANEEISYSTGGKWLTPIDHLLTMPNKNEILDGLTQSIRTVIRATLNKHLTENQRWLYDSGDMIERRNICITYDANGTFNNFYFV